MTNEDLDRLMAEIEDELIDHAVPVWLVPAWIRGQHRDLDEQVVTAASLQLCELLLSRDDVELTWMQGHYDQPWPDGPRRQDRPAPDAVDTSMFDGPDDPLGPDLYLAIHRVGHLL